MTFKPNKKQLHAAEMVFIAMALEETIRPIVEKYHQEILDYEKYPYAEKWHKNHDVDFGDYIKTDKDTYLMEDSDLKHYIDRCRIEQKKAGLFTEKKEFCPLLVAEHNTMKANHYFIETMEPVTKISLDIATSNLDVYKKLVELSLRLLAPFVDADGALKMVS